MESLRKKYNYPTTNYLLKFQSFKCKFKCENCTKTGWKYFVVGWEKKRKEKWKNLEVWKEIQSEIPLK